MSFFINRLCQKGAWKLPTTKIDGSGSSVSRTSGSARSMEPILDGNSNLGANNFKFGNLICLRHFFFTSEVVENLKLFSKKAFSSLTRSQRVQRYPVIQGPGQDQTQ